MCAWDLSSYFLLLSLSSSSSIAFVLGVVKNICWGHAFARPMLLGLPCTSAQDSLLRTTTVIPILLLRNLCTQYAPCFLRSSQCLMIGNSKLHGTGCLPTGFQHLEDVSYFKNIMKRRRNRQCLHQFRVFCETHEAFLSPMHIITGASWL